MTDEAVKLFSKALNSGDFSAYLRGDFEKWFSNYGEILADADPDLIIDVIKQVNQGHELFQVSSISAMIHVAYRRRPELLSRYVSEAMKFAKHERIPSIALQPVFGIVLTGISLLSEQERDTALYDLFNTALMTPYVQGTRAHNYLVNEVAKHCLANGLSQLSDEDILARALQRISLDVPAFDLLIFAYRRKGHFHALAPLVPLIAERISCLPDAIVRICMSFGDTRTLHQDVFQQVLKQTDTFNQKLQKDGDEDLRRYGMLLRIGEYLTYGSDNKLASIGKELRQSVVNKWQNKTIPSLSPMESRRLFRAIETLDELGVAEFCSKAEMDLDIISPLRCFLYAPLALIVT